MDKLDRKKFEEEFEKIFGKRKNESDLS